MHILTEIRSTAPGDPVAAVADEVARRLAVSRRAA
jgi:hypothetical protein